MGSSSLARVGVNLSSQTHVSHLELWPWLCPYGGPRGLPEGRRETQDSGDSGQRLRVKRALGRGCPGGPGPGAAGSAHLTGAWKTRATPLTRSSRKPPKVPAADLHEEAWLRRCTGRAPLASPQSQVLSWGLLCCLLSVGPVGMPLGGGVAV